MSPFPLLRLPLLPLKSVLDKLYIGALIRLHWCSLKTRALLKAIKKSVTFDSLKSFQKRELNLLELLDLLRLEIYNNPHGSFACFLEESVTITILITSSDGIVVLIGANNVYEDKYRNFFPLYFYLKPLNHQVAEEEGNLKIDGIFGPVVIKSKHEFHTFWNDQSDGLNNLLSYFKTFFNLKTTECFICGDMDSKFSENLKATIRGISQHTIDNCVIREDTSIVDYKLILDNICPTYRFEQVNDYAIFSDDCRHETSFKSKYFELKPANWFAFRNLITMECEFIKLLESSLTNDDMQEYARQWMSGRFPKLKQLTVQLEETVDLSHFLSRLQEYSFRYKVVPKLQNICIELQNVTVASISASEDIFEFHILRDPRHFDN